MLLNDIKNEKTNDFYDKKVKLLRKLTNYNNGFLILLLITKCKSVPSHRCFVIFFLGTTFVGITEAL